MVLKQEDCEDVAKNKDPSLEIKEVRIILEKLKTDPCKKPVTLLKQSKLFSKPIKKSKTEAMHECPHCHKSYKGNYIRQHIKLSHGEKVYKNCEKCGKCCTKEYLRYHQLVCLSDGKRPFKCEEEGCSSTFITSTGLNYHKKEVHSDLIKCPFENCRHEFKHSNLRNHIKVMHQNFKKSCGKCGKMLSHAGLANHVKKCLATEPPNKDKIFKCTVEGCEQLFTAEENRRLHVYRVHTVKRFACPYKDCKAFLKPHMLPGHIKAVHEKIMKNCSKCGKTLLEISMKRHELKCMSDGVKRFKCQIKYCTSAFVLEVELKNHLRSHKSQEKCPIPGCSEIIRPIKLRPHIKKFHRTDTCRNCGKMFIDFKNVTAHIKSCIC